MTMERATAQLRDDTVLATLLERIKSALHPELVYLFGSRAKGVAAAESDYDFLVVVPHSEKPRYQRDQEAFLTLCGSGVAKDVIVLTREEFESSQRAVPPITGDSLFHCQQAVEKALKGFLAAHEGRLQKTHDLETLSLQCAEIAPHLESTLRGAYFLTTFASEFRYPGDVTEPGVEEANTGLAIASEVVEVIVSCLDRIP